MPKPSCTVAFLNGIVLCLGDTHLVYTCNMCINDHCDDELLGHRLKIYSADVPIN